MNRLKRLSRSMRKLRIPPRPPGRQRPLQTPPYPKSRAKSVSKIAIAASGSPRPPPPTPRPLTKARSPLKNRLSLNSPSRSRKRNGARLPQQSTLVLAWASMPRALGVSSFRLTLPDARMCPDGDLQTSSVTICPSTQLLVLFFPSRESWLPEASDTDPGH